MTYSNSKKQRRSAAILFGLILAMLMTVAALAANSVTPHDKKSGTKSKVKVAAVVQITNMLTFSAKKDTIYQGETVRWVNGSVIVHTVTADPKLATMKESVLLPKGAKPFNSGNMDAKETFEHTFTVPGTYRYFCIPHEAAKMVGEIVVLPAKK